MRGSGSRKNASAKVRWMCGIKREVRVAGKRPHRPYLRGATVHAAMGDILKVVRFDSVFDLGRYDGRDGHPVSA
jgi:hypothetical protein